MRTLWLGETSYRKISVFNARFQFYIAVVCLAVFIFSFFSLLFSIVRRWILKRKVARVQYLSFGTILSLVLMVVAISLFYDPMQLYSSGAILFYASSWIFLLLSFTALFYFLKYLLSNKKVGRWLLVQTGMGTVSCVCIACYLMYWGIIGLRLWDY